MARRARQAFSVFRDARREFAELDFPALVKLGYRVDGGGEDDREHLWFQVHEVHEDSVDATLINPPFRVSALRANERRRHPLELLSDWTIFTPFGQVDPRQTRTLRLLRENPERVRAAVEAHRQRRS
jgi:hypothetical protein